MLDKLVDFGKQLFTLKVKVEKNTVGIQELRDNLQELTSDVTKLTIANNELKILFTHLKETEGTERHKLVREWQIYQQDQEIVFLKLKNMLQSEQISRLSEKSDQTKLLGGKEQDT
jgi:predicted RNase H-like nuclease (RuvC/YqgF family)